MKCFCAGPRQPNTLPTLYIKVLAVLFTTSVAEAAVYPPFHGWGPVITASPDILIARCEAKPPVQGTNASPRTFPVRGIFNSDARVLYVLRGVTSAGTVQIQSTRLLQAGEDYLLFSTRNDGVCYAVASYQLVSLGTNFPLGLLTGKGFEHQLQAAFRCWLDLLHQEPASTNQFSAQIAEERARIEEGAKGRFTDDQARLLESLTNGTAPPDLWRRTATNGPPTEK